MSSKTQAFFDLVEQRRSNYALTPETTISEAEIVSIVERAVKHTPTSFNLQSVRAAVLFGAAYRQTLDKAKNIALEKVFKGNDERAAKVAGQFDNVFSKGYGAVLFFNDTAITNKAAENMPLFASSFPVWAEDSSGMLQYVVWTALTAEGFACNLQHHASLDKEINDAFTISHQLPATWECTAFMPFGKAAAPPREKTFAPLEERVRVIR